MIAVIVTLVLVGMAAGAVALLVVPAREELPLPGTIVLGVAGSLVGGFLGYVVFGNNGLVRPAGILASLVGSLVGAVTVLALWARAGSQFTIHR